MKHSPSQSTSAKQSSKKIIIAAAGSRKTTSLVEIAIASSNKRILILTYTIDNLKQINDCFVQKCGFVPEHVSIQTWFAFLLRDCVRPYQSYMYSGPRIESLRFVPSRSTKWIKKSDVNRYYIHGNRHIYSDKISEFACLCNAKSGSNHVMRRLEKIYDLILIDEIQDMAGYDFDLFQLLLESSIDIVMVGDNRQATYFTNCSPKYNRYKGKSIIDLFKDFEGRNLCSIEYRTECYRCNQEICTFADRLYPGMPKTLSRNSATSGHDGVFGVPVVDLSAYVANYSPKILQHDKRSHTHGYDAMNFGVVKGQTFDRVLIFPTKAMETFLEMGGPSELKDATRAKLYVAITRAKYSVAFVLEDNRFGAMLKRTNTDRVIVDELKDGKHVSTDNR